MPFEVSTGQPSYALPINVERQGLRDAAGLEIAQSSQFNRGWQSADIGEDANALMWKSNQAAISGDVETAAVLRQQGTDLMRQAQQWAPTVRDMTDINGVGSAIDWAGGAMGNLRSSVKPALGGLAGLAIGAVAAPFTAGVINPMLGARVGAGLAGYNTMTEGNAADMMMDSEITSTPQEIANAARGAGVVQGALESVVPAGVVGSLAGMGGRKAAAEIAKNGLLKTAGKRVGINAAEEFATEFAQNPVGDIAKNYLKGEDLTDIDWKAALNAGAAGAIGGGGMGAMGAGADALHAQLGKGVDKAKEIKNDPLGAVLDAGVDLAAKAGTLKAKAENYFDERELKSKGYTQEEIDKGRLEQIQATLAGKSDLKSTATISDEENLMDAPSFNAHHEAKLKEDAATILKAGRDSTDAEKDIASKFASGAMDAVEFQTRLHQAQKDKVADKETNDLLTGLGQNTKKSEMRTSDRMYLESELLKPEAQQQKLNTLTDIMVKQGVDEKIINATNGEHNRTQLAGMLKWISDGMNDTPEAVTAIVNRFGSNSSAIFKKAYGLAKNNGLIKPNDEFAEEVVSRLDFAANTERVIHKALKDNLSDIALHGVEDVEGAVKKLVPMMKVVVQEGMSPTVKRGLIDNFFGTEERLHNVMNAYIDTGEHKKQVSKATGGGKEEVEIDADGNIVPEQQFDEDGELIVNKYGAGASVSEIKGPKIVGFTNPKGRVGIPFNLGFDKGIEKYEAVKAQHSSELGNSVVDVGIWSRTKADLANDASAIEQAGYDLLESFGPKLMPEGRYASLIKGFSEGTIDIGDLSPRQRAVLLGRINRQFRYLEVTKSDSGDSRHNIQDIEQFKWNPKDAKPETFTAQNGVLFLERNMPGKGLTHFPVSTDSLRKQGIFTENGTRAKGKDGGVFPVGNFENQDGPTGSTLEGKRRGALGSSDLVMSGLTDLMLAEGGNFTSRIGYRTAPGQPLQWVENRERLPKEMLLGRQHTVGDAKTQADIERREEKPTDAGIGFAENHKERVAALIAVAKAASTPSKKSEEIFEVISKGAPAVVRKYRELRDQWQGTASDVHLSTSPHGHEKHPTIGRKAPKYKGTRNALWKGSVKPFPQRAMLRDMRAVAKSGKETSDVFKKTLASLEADEQAWFERLAEDIDKAEDTTVPSERTQDEDVKDTSRAEDGDMSKAIERDELDGRRVGYGADAVGAGYEGPASPRTRHGTQADPARKVKREGGDQFAARDWVANLLVEGADKASSAISKLKSVAQDRVSVGLSVLVSMTPDTINNVIFDGKLSSEKAQSVFDNAVAMGAKTFAAKIASTKFVYESLSKSVANFNKQVVGLKTSNPLGVDPREGLENIVAIGTPQGIVAVLGTAQLVPTQYEIYDTNKKGYKLIPKEIIDNYDSAVQEAAKLLARAKTILESGGVQLDVKGETSGNVGQGNALGVDRGTGGNPAADQQTTASNADMGTGSQGGTSGEQAVTVKESASSGYPERTKHNADSADVTIAFAIDHTTAGEVLTARLAGDKLVKFESSLKAFAEAIIAKLKSVNGASINVAGNGMSTWAKHGGTQEAINQRMFKVLKMVKEQHPALNKIVTGGQTGSDIAGAIAAKALGIPVEVTMPKGFKQKLGDGSTITQTQAAVLKQIEDGAAALSAPKQSAQTPNANPKSKEEFEASVVQAGAHILFTLGKNVKVAFEKMTNGSGSWTEGQTMNTIKLALNGDVLGAAFHESFHEFMNILKKNGGDKTSDVLKRAAMNPIIQRKLEILLNGHPEAIKQLADPEEAAAFMYQFWSAGLLKIGPDTKSAFTTVKNFLKRVAAVFSETFRKEVEAMSREQMEAGHAELLMRQFTEGAVSNMDTRKMIVEAMEKSTELHDAAVERVGETFQKFANVAGKLVMSSEAMMEATGNKHMVEIMRGFHQKVGTAMLKHSKAVGSYSDGLRQTTSQWVHKVEAVLEGYSAEEIELAREAMSKGVEPTDRVAKELVAKINGFYAEMAEYMDAKDVRRLNMERIDPVTGTHGAWEKIPLRKNYLPQVWSIDTLMNDFPTFKADLLKHHMVELQHIADAANKEVRADKLPAKGTAARAEFDRAEQEFKDSGKVMAKLNLQTITPEMVADAIGTRLLQSNGHIEINESNSGLGITPAASAVNKRELNWLDKEVFDKYKEKDLTSIMTTYAHSIVKRGEYQSRFGYGGEKIADGAAKAVLHELGGDELVELAEKVLPTHITAWKKAKAKDDMFNESFPTLRSVGQKLNAAKVGQEKHDAALIEAMKKLENGFNAIQALEGTLGRDITPGARTVNSWLVTYQSFRTLSTMLFTSFQDVAGIVVNGGEAKDAWDAFVEGIREIRNTVFDHKNPSASVLDAEFWGTVDSGAYLESTAQAQGSPFMSGKAKVWSDKFFKYTGAVGWNRGVRSVATRVGERIITGWKTNGVDMKDMAAVARLEDLFGKGFDPTNIKLDADGRLDKTDPANQAAITRWVLTAVPAPTAAHRTIWMSDPHYAVFAQLKNYTYSFHRIMMKNAADQARLGNYRPVMAMMLGYAPIAIAAGAIKEMLIPGEEPPWMKGGLDGYLSYGFSRAGVLGVPQMMLGSIIDVGEVPGLNFGKAGSSFDPAALAGPTADQIQNILSVPFGEFMAMRDHTMIGEGLGALPGGNVLKRLERLGSV